MKWLPLLLKILVFIALILIAPTVLYVIFYFLVLLFLAVPRIVLWVVAGVCCMGVLYICVKKYLK